MAALDDLLARVADPALRADLEREIAPLRGEQELGLVFERHLPETVRLPGHPVRRGVTVTDRAGEDDALWRVTRVTKGVAQLRRTDADNTIIEDDRPVEELVVVREFGEPIFPGLKSVGRVERGGEKPFHTVINAENYHALETLLYTCEGQVDAIYIDPPYNSGARDWKYNNDYVDGQDRNRHSKWLSFMEKRLLLAKRLLNPENSVLVVTIDEKEYLRLGLLLEQVFPNARIQMVSIAINPSGGKRDLAFRRSDEYAYFVKFGTSSPVALELGPEWQGGKGTSTGKLRWNGLMRSGTGARREDRPGMFYPIFIDVKSGAFHSVGGSLDPTVARTSVVPPTGTVAVWPIRSDNSEGRWQVGPSTARGLRKKGYLRVGGLNSERTPISYLKQGEQKKVQAGVFGNAEIGGEGHIVVSSEAEGGTRVPTTQWTLVAHSAADHGSTPP